MYKGGGHPSVLAEFLFHSKGGCLPCTTLLQLEWHSPGAGFTSSTDRIENFPDMGHSGSTVLCKLAINVHPVRSSSWVAEDSQPREGFRVCLECGVTSSSLKHFAHGYVDKRKSLPCYCILLVHRKPGMASGIAKITRMCPSID